MKKHYSHSTSGHCGVFLCCVCCAEFTFMCHWWSGSDCVLRLENESDLEMIGKEHVITLMNHKYDIDWLMAWILAERFQMLGVTRLGPHSTSAVRIFKISNRIE